MKFLHTLIASLFCFVIYAQQPFVTTWEVTAGDLDIFIPASSGYNYSYNYTIDFGDGTVLNNQTGDTSHTYSSPGIYTVSISGVFPHLVGNSFGSYSQKIMTIEQWGDIQWQRMSLSFKNCENLTINATDMPDLSNVTSMYGMFKGAESVNSPTISNWDVSNVTNMGDLFSAALSFNQPLNNWDVSNVTIMAGMFSGFNFQNNTFNQPLDNWDVSNVTNMRNMFIRSDFNQTLNNWDVSNVTNMNRMFKNSVYNLPLNNWDVSNVTDMQNMFENSDFNQSLNNWDVSNVSDMSEMFKNSVFDQPLDNWDVANVSNMQEMFENSNFNKTINNWDVSNVINMIKMFRNSVYNLPLNNWDVSNVTDMQNMFENSEFNQSINNWNVSNVSDMSEMFKNSVFDQPLDNWDVYNVTNMVSMFENSAYNQPLNNWDVSNVSNMSNMFRNSPFNQSLNDWNISNVTSTRSMFRESDFNQPLNNWDVSNVSIMRSMFSETDFNQPLDNWDVSNVTNMRSMFFKSDLNQDLSGWDFETNDLLGFISNSSMDSQNYDSLLDRLVQLDLEDGILSAWGLNYCDAFTRGILTNNQNWNISDSGISDDCNVNYISGYIKFDEDGNGCDTNDNPITQLTINTNDGQDDLSVLTDDQGDYLVTVNQGTFDVTMLNLPNYLDASPSSHNVSFNSTDEIEDQKDFCVTANQDVEDLNIEVFSIDGAVPGFESEYEIIVKNFGTQTQNNIQVDFSFEDTYQSFVSASQSANQNGNSLSFDIASLSPFTSETINLTLLNVQPPNLNSGDVLSFDADVSPNTNDINPDDNTVNFDQTVVNSYDPNDKLVTQGKQIPDEKIDEYLDYKIRFQNVGTANAINVTITDTISDKLDWTTFQPINSSHNYRLELVEQEEINFIFENINLPYEAIDEPGSNGHVSFKIKPKDNVQIGDIIENKAYIFFDFNAPIITNTVSTEIVDNLSTTDFIQADNIKLSPNPSDDRVEIINASNAAIQSLQLYSIKGQLINTFTDKSLIDISSLSSGVYILQIETRNNKINKRLIKR